MDFSKLLFAIAALSLGGCSFKSSESRQQSPAIFVDNLRVAYLSTQRTLNEYLSLTHHYSYHFRFKPQFNPDAALSRNNAPITLPPGTRVRVKVFLLHPETQTQVEFSAQAASLPSSLPFPWIAGFDDVVSIPDSGFIDVPVTLPVRNIFRNQLASTTSLLLEITPERPSVPVGATLLQGNFQAVAPPNRTAETPLFRTANSARLEDFVQRVTHASGSCNSAHASPTALCFSAGPEWKRPPLDLFVEYWKRARPLRLVALTPDLGDAWEQGDRALTEQLGPLTNGGVLPTNADQRIDGWLTQLCSRAPRVISADCATHPRMYFRVDRVTVMDSVANVQVQVKGKPKIHTLETSANFFREQMVSHKATEGDREATERSNSLYSKFAYEVYGSGGGHTQSVTWKDESYATEEFSVQSDLRSRMQLQERIQFMAEEQKIDVVGKGRLCLFIRVLPAARPSEEALPNMLLCGNRLHLKSTPESFYYIWDHGSQTAGNVIDSREASSSEWSKLLRGTKAFEQFRNSIADGVRLLVLRKIEPVRDGGNRIVSNAFYSPEGWQYRIDGGELPGVLQTIQITPHKWDAGRLTEVVQACVGTEPAQAVELNSPEWRKWQRRYQYCHCFYDAAARQWDHSYFAKNYTTLDKSMNNSINQSCTEWAGGMWK